MDLRDYWLTIRRRWMLIVACLLATVGAAAIYTWQATPQYSSTAQLFVSTTPSDVSDAFQGGQFATQRVTSYADLVGTRQLAEQVSDLLGGEIDPDRLRDSVQAEVVPETVNLTITATDPDPATARDVAQAYAEALSDLVAAIETPDGRKDAPIKASIVDNAEVSDDPVSPQPVRNLGLGLALGLLLGVGVAVLRELMDTSISTAEDVANTTSAPILGRIGTDAAAVKRDPASALAEAAPWAESYRVLRTNMQYVESDQEHRSFVVSSALSDEGKTTTATNLAITLAMAGQRVALVECDLRKPRLAERLGLDGAVGTTNVLIGKVGWREALQPYAGTGLEVLASGPIPPNPSELLQSHSMESLLADMREHFDIVLIDAPPLLPVTDAALLAARTDGLILVLRHARTTRDQLAHALERVEAVGAKCVGVVLNLAPLKKKGGQYGYGYGYGAEATAASSRADLEKEPTVPPRRTGQHRNEYSRD